MSKIALMKFIIKRLQVALEGQFDFLYLANNMSWQGAGMNVKNGFN